MIKDKLNNILKNATATIIEKAGDAADKIFTSKEEKNNFTLALEQLKSSDLGKQYDKEIKEIELDNAEMANARNHDIEIQREANASWLSKNVAYCIDIFIILLWGVLTIYMVAVMLNIVTKQTGVDYTAITAVWGGVSTLAGTVLNFHRGGSRGSEYKNRMIANMLKK